MGRALAIPSTCADRGNVPFADVLADLVPPSALRLRRDIGKVLDLVRAHALLHQETRARAHGHVVAEMADYAAVYALIDDLIAEGVRDSVADRVRATVGAVVNMVSREGAVSLADLASYLGVSVSTASRRVAQCVALGYLKRQADRTGAPPQIVAGDPLPDGVPCFRRREHCNGIAPLHAHPRRGTPLPVVPSESRSFGTTGHGAEARRWARV